MKLTVIEPAAPMGAPSNEETCPGADHDDWEPGWTSRKQAEFLRQLAATHCVSEAARRVGMGRQSAYKLRARLKGEPFDIAWQAAFRMQYDALLEAVVERAIHGVEVPHFHKGELIHTSRRFDDRAAVALIALRRQLPAKGRCLGAAYEGVGTKEFESLIARVEYGEERWELPPYDPNEDSKDYFSLDG